jgi:hypothetical protein
VNAALDTVEPPAVGAQYAIAAAVLTAARTATAPRLRAPEADVKSRDTLRMEEPPYFVDARTAPTTACGRLAHSPAVDPSTRRLIQRIPHCVAVDPYVNFTGACGPKF